MAEGAQLPDGGFVGEKRDQVKQQMKLGGVGTVVAREIEERLHRETRCVVLGHLQRGGNPTSFDRALATQFGTHAVRLVHEQRFGEMVCYWPPRMDSVAITDAVNKLSTVDPNCSAVQSARALGISFGDCAKARSPFELRDSKAVTAKPNPTPAPVATIKPVPVAVPLSASSIIDHVAALATK